MAYAPLIFFLILLLPLLRTHAYKHETCPELINYSCNDFNGTSVMSPFTNNTKPDCGLCVLDCNNHTSSTIQCGGQQLSYQTKQILPHNNTVVLVYPGLRQILSNVCNVHRNDTISIPNLPKTSFKILNLMVFYRCDADSDAVEGPSTACGSEVVYGPYAADIFPKGTPPDCVSIQLPNSTDNTFSIKYHLPNCFDQSIGVLGCHQKGKKNVKLILTSVLPGCMLIILALVILYCRKRKIKPGSSAIISFDQTRSYLELEEGSVNGVTLFSYQELEKATNHFDPTKLLGEGGFGIVYHGKLRDGREVAVKRLYEKSSRRIQQFENEIKILTHLRHNNLVTLYGYTSHHSSELLLVYEYIPNGTVTDHLRGEHPNSEFLTWSTRMNIAIETAQVLSYLHYNDIIHRDVKTNNILLDNSFSVKVADFGLSRLFPVDVTHVSTAPQGTPGYVDPEYHQCYHLTDKSDVYSFGVVLIELLSSLPAVDVGRHRHEINLSNYAFNKIKCCAFGELVDPKLGFETDSEVRRMTTLVAELAFRCLQHDREVRPSMDEVLHALKMIVSLETDIKPQPSSANIDVQRPQSSPEPVKEKWLSESMKRRPSLKEDDGLTILRISKEQSNPYSHIENDDVGLLRNAHLMPTSPDSVMDIRFSKSCTPNTSS